MGYSVSSIAVRGKSPDAVLEILGASRTGAREECPDTPLVGAELPGGWYLIVSQKDAIRAMEGDLLARLSADGEAVACVAFDSLAYSAAACWHHGQQLWSVVHNAQDVTKHWVESLEISGQLPEGFADIHARWTGEQQKAGGRKARVDYIMEIPVDLVCAITGYRHDRDLVGMGEQPFDVLTIMPKSIVSKESGGKQGPWWRRLFGSG